MVLGAIGFCSGLVSASTCVAVTNPNLSWWQYLLIACVPTLLGFVLDMVRKYCKINITEKQKEHIVKKGTEVITDLIDDGKINNSNNNVKQENGKE